MPTTYTWPSGVISSVGVRMTAGRHFGFRPCGSRIVTQTTRPWDGCDMANPSEGLAVVVVPGLRVAVRAANRLQLLWGGCDAFRGKVFKVLGGLPAQREFLQPTVQRLRFVHQL